jgi:hypothetical protein
VRTSLGEGSVELLHDARRIGRQVEIGGARLDASDEAVRSERDRLHIARFRQRGKDDVGLPCEGARALRPDGAIGQMMAGRLPVQVVDDQLEAGSLHVGGHAAAHGAQPDEPYRHVVLGHPFTVAAISDFGTTQASRVLDIAEGRRGKARCSLQERACAGPSKAN